MGWPATEFTHCLTQLHFDSPLYARCNFAEFDCSIGYLPTARWTNFAVEIQLGYGLMFLEKHGLRFILAHELSHAQNGDLPWMMDTITLSPLMRIHNRIRFLLRFLPKAHRCAASEADELAADLAAAKVCDPIPYAKSLICSVAALEAYVKWLNSGSFGTGRLEVEQDLDIDDFQLRSSVPEMKVLSAILHGFRSNSDFLFANIENAIANDKPDGVHPSIEKRITHLGLNLNTTINSLAVDTANLIDLTELMTWLPEPRKITN